MRILLAMTAALSALSTRGPKSGDQKRPMLGSKCFSRNAADVGSCTLAPSRPFCAHEDWRPAARAASRADGAGRCRYEQNLTSSHHQLQLQIATIRAPREFENSNLEDSMQAKPDIETAGLPSPWLNSGLPFTIYIQSTLIWCIN